uniref:mRNA splicing factor U2 snRNP subunit n=1 Tax=Lotharella vacuolata TaxID=74820 RepID=A0A0H5BH95_9EUKA|nr:mRNA splicing factor U2 snRNP subunit [Lotharella vacuolata]
MKKYITSVCTDFKKNNCKKNKFDNICSFNMKLDAILPGEDDGYRIFYLKDHEEEPVYTLNNGFKTKNFINIITEKKNTIKFNEIKERKFLKLLLKIKNGLPIQRKNALKQISIKACEFGPNLIFHHVLPLIMDPTLDSHERHLMVKVIERILLKLKTLIRPYISKILLIILPLLIEEDNFARIEGRELIASLTKAVGVATMITALRPDIDNIDEYVRSTCARAFSVVVISVGVPVLLPFMVAVCKSKKSWHARHTGIKIVQQVAILMGNGILPYCNNLLGIIKHGLIDENIRIRTITALTIASLAEAVFPYGIKIFDNLINLLTEGIRFPQKKLSAAFLKAVSCVIPLLSTIDSSNYCSIILTLILEKFNTPDMEIKKIMLKIILFFCNKNMDRIDYFLKKIYYSFFSCFWTKNTIKNNSLFYFLKKATVSFSKKIGQNYVMTKLLYMIKNEGEIFKHRALETLYEVLKNINLDNISLLLVEEFLEIFLKFLSTGFVDLNGYFIKNLTIFFVNYASISFKYIRQILYIIKKNLKNKNYLIRQTSAELVIGILDKLNTPQTRHYVFQITFILTENLTEENPNTLSIIIFGIIKALKISEMVFLGTSGRIIIPKLIPILKNKSKEVQKNAVILLGYLADKIGVFLSPKEWLRISFSLLDVFRSDFKNVRRNAVNTFGIIAKVIGPQDILYFLLNNLKVQERQCRISTAIAIAIICEICSPAIVLPYLIQEYIMLDSNIQNGILKSLAFLFEFIGEQTKNLMLVLLPLLESAITNQDVVHRQISCNIIQHISINVLNLNCDDLIQHLFNYIWPNIFEKSPHMKKAVINCIDSCRITLGAPLIYFYVLNGLFHPSRKVRDIYWYIHNLIYVGSQPTLIVSYPNLERFLMHKFLKM